MPKHYRPAGKKKEGNVAKYITRTKALRQLQISLQNFRKLCILKGIFPREPKKKVEGNHKTYYHVKDIAFLAHEPILETLRDKRVHEKKVNKALAKKNKPGAERLLTRQPTYKLDKILLERFPKFVDALRELDDCLSMVHLFAALPAVEREHIGVNRIRTCRRLSHEWQAYVSRTHKLRKTFITVKGTYYQAEIQGQKITWLVPHALQQVISDDVDYNVMKTFLEVYELWASIGDDYVTDLEVMRVEMRTRFILSTYEEKNFSKLQTLRHDRNQLVDDYTSDFYMLSSRVVLLESEAQRSLLGFVNCQLYHSISMKYPPILDPRLEALAADLYALTRDFTANSRALEVPTVGSSEPEKAEVGNKSPQDEKTVRTAQLQHQVAMNQPGTLMHLVEEATSEDNDDEETRECKNLFKNSKFFLSREGFRILVRGWWESFLYQGRQAKVFRCKLNAFNEKLQFWNKKVLGMVDMRLREISIAIQALNSKVEA
ncbi:hypothetical protein GIB67_030771 [Kingdonia uniflora]|uniref:Pescadillo homolog n=1 Tax=Kingdonia uniflora TaxID=39325 RepID=A0A7J7L351_9MAGN|nr:hypothetical protein GIB67_030771 [Kingdonia uniflora]